MIKSAILRQLGYGVSENSLAQVQKAMDNTKEFDYVQKHLIALHDTLRPRLSFVALSSSKDCFKIKNEAQGEEMIKSTNEIIQKWSKKYKIELEKVSGKETYYILGKSA